ncbi:MAG: hypothetical protein DDT37_01678 [Firmicutes bacterium]|nr:hypothetical protein [candidate division NPL-UPA2 bacterium]
MCVITWASAPRRSPMPTAGVPRPLSNNPLMPCRSSCTKLCIPAGLISAGAGAKTCALGTAGVNAGLILASAPRRSPMPTAGVNAGLILASAPRRSPMPTAGIPTAGVNAGLILASANAPTPAATIVGAATSRSRAIVPSAAARTSASAACTIRLNSVAYGPIPSISRCPKVAPISRHPSPYPLSIVKISS